MIKTLYRKAHVSADLIRLGDKYLFKKSSWSLIDLSKVKPNLIIIGSQKCGTTSLHENLNKHPDIFMSYPMKEPGYFMFDNWAQNYWKEKGININTKKILLLKHMLKGYAGQRYFGESSTYYTQDEREVAYQIPQNIINEVGIPKLIFIIRNPLERLVSVFYHINKFNNYSGTFEDMLNIDKSYLNTSLYFSRLKAYIDVFGKENIKLVFFEDLVNQPQVLMSELYSFLELEDFIHDEFKKFNVTSPKQKVKFSKSSFQNIKEAILRDKALLEKNFNISLTWNLTEKDWVF